MEDFILNLEWRLNKEPITHSRDSILLRIFLYLKFNANKGRLMSVPCIENLLNKLGAFSLFLRKSKIIRKQSKVKRVQYVKIMVESRYSKNKVYNEKVYR